LILINVAVFLANGLLTPPPEDSTELGKITGLLAATDNTLWNPLLWWQFVTYGFAHGSVMHILFNMLQLWFLGRAVEQLYGRAEFLWIYSIMLVVGSLVWAITSALSPDNVFHQLIGASGAVSGVVILFVLNYPQQTLTLFPIPIPIKAWVIGVLLVVMNLVGAFRDVGSTAFGVHLTGIAFAYLYFQNRWNLSLLTRRLFSWRGFRLRPRLRIHHPTDEDADLSEEVDRILEKIHRQGEASLTRKERRTLESASREYQRRRRVGKP
ncbi:MAG: hypothetical protein A2V70_15535, partial [Planctomycetes bacterium RBG_13_63_9]